VSGREGAGVRRREDMIHLQGSSDEIESSDRLV
jgi:hypothetical protein